MSRILQSDDLEKNMLFTVLRGKMMIRESIHPNGREIKDVEAKHYNGKVFKLIAIDLPYIVAEYYEGKRKTVTNFDVREIIIGTVNPGYVKGIAPWYVENIKVNQGVLWTFSQEEE